MELVAFTVSQLRLPEKAIRNTIKLLEEDCTIPFISRYRKEMTGNLDEIQIGDILKCKETYESLQKRKQAILKAIEEQNALTDELRSKIDLTNDIVQLEDIYLPYKKKRSTKATMAKEKGLEGLAKIIMKQEDENVQATAKRFVNEKVKNEDDALQGARDIIAEWINENERVRKRLRRFFQREAQIQSKVIKEKEGLEEAGKYQQYFDWSSPLFKCPSHRLLAVFRAEKEEIVRVKIVIDREKALDIVDDVLIRSDVKSATDQIFIAVEDAYKRLLYPSLSNEILSEAKEKADIEAIKVFSNNLRQLLLASPLGEKRILAIDPGYKSGCKLVCLDEKGDLKHNETIYPHAPQRQTGLAIKKIKSLVNAYKIEAIAIGNGTASRETEAFIKKIGFNTDLQVFIVNESGASVYSASKIAREEFPNYDVTVRGAVSIGRRLSDPLAELVKIDPKAIGVGQYQHDVDQSKLKKELDTVVMSCVNKVGVNINTASRNLLSYVSGIGISLADQIVKYRSEQGKINSREELIQIPRLGTKAFEQSAAFFRITEAENPLDNSAVHPEHYPIVKKMAKDLGVPLIELIGDKAAISKISLENYCTEKVGLPTLTDIVKEMEKPGLDPRKKAKVFEFAKGIKTIDDLKTGMTLPGIVNNITNFGCFVDIGIKESGLVHISKLSKEFVSDVNSVVSLHQHIEVKVVEIDLPRKRIQLSMID